MKKTQKKVARHQTKQKPAVAELQPEPAWMTVGNLKRSLKRVNDDAPVFLTLNGPHVSVAGVHFYEVGHNNQPSLLLVGNPDELPDTPEPWEKLLLFVGQACMENAAKITKVREYFAAQRNRK